MHVTCARGEHALFGEKLHRRLRVEGAHPVCVLSVNVCVYVYVCVRASVGVCVC